MAVLNRAEEHSGRGACAAIAAAQPVVPVRHRIGTVGLAARSVHLIPALIGKTSAVGALCGVLLSVRDIEIVNPGQGMPCTVCVLNHVADTPVERPAGSADKADAADRMGGITYRAWGWPVTGHPHGVRLSLHRNVSAIVIPIPILLGAETTRILFARRCGPPVMAHTSYPEHHILLAGERYGVTLPWPLGVHQLTGALLLPPGVSRRGPVTWIRPPQADSLRLCREIDMFAALRTALKVPRAPRPSLDGRETVGRDEEDKNLDKNDDDGGRHRDEDNTGDGSRDRPIPPPPDPNKHDR